MDQDQALLMQMMGGAHEGVHAGGPGNISMDDPGQIDWGAIANMFQLSPEEVQQLQVPVPPGGPSLADRLQALRPQGNVGPMRMGFDGSRVTGRMDF